MRNVAARLLPEYLEALDRALAEALGRLPVGQPRGALARLRRRLRHPGTPLRIEALYRLVLLGELQGWLDPRDAIVIRKLAWRVGFLAGRATAVSPPTPPALADFRFATRGLNREGRGHAGRSRAGAVARRSGSLTTRRSAGTGALRSGPTAVIFVLGCRLQSGSPAPAAVTAQGSRAQRSPGA